MATDYFFARFYDPFVDPFIRKVRYKVLQLAKDLGAKNVLDVCCGTGNQLKLLKLHGFKVTGIDLSDQMIGVSRRGKNAVNCLKGDATSLPFPDGSYDLVTISLALHENSRNVAIAILKEMHRVTVPGGHIIVADYDITSKTSRFSHFLTRTVEKMAGGEHYANYRKYVDRGGLPDILNEIPHREAASYLFGGDSLVLKVLVKD